jgi:hypothetical protein
MTLLAAGCSAGPSEGSVSHIVALMVALAEIVS